MRAPRFPSSSTSGPPGGAPVPRSRARASRSWRARRTDDGGSSRSTPRRIRSSRCAIGIRSIPAVKLFAAGRRAVAGVRRVPCPEPEIVRWLDTHLPPPAEQTAARERGRRTSGGGSRATAMEMVQGPLPEDDDTPRRRPHPGSTHFDIAQREVRRRDHGRLRDASGDYLDGRGRDFANGAAARQALEAWIQPGRNRSRPRRRRSTAQRALRRFDLLGEDDPI